MNTRCLTITLGPDWRSALRKAGRSATATTYQGETPRVIGVSIAPGAIAFSVTPGGPRHRYVELYIATQSGSRE